MYKSNSLGHACKSLAQRLYITPSTSVTTPETVTEEPGCCLLPSTVDVGTQTTLTLPVNSDWYAIILSYNTGLSLEGEMGEIIPQNDLTSPKEKVLKHSKNAVLSL